MKVAGEVFPPVAGTDKSEIFHRRSYLTTEITEAAEGRTLIALN
jgi:hypothetical protein